MWKEIFNKPTKWSVMKGLIFKEVDDLIINSLGIVAFISFFVGGVVAIQTALNLTNPFIPKYLMGFATRQSMILEFAPYTRLEKNSVLELMLTVASGCSTRRLNSVKMRLIKLTVASGNVLKKNTG